MLDRDLEPDCQEMLYHCEPEDDGLWEDDRLIDKAQFFYECRIFGEPERKILWRE